MKDTSLNTHPQNPASIQFGRMWNAHTLTHTKNVKGTLHSCRSVSHPLWAEMCFHHTINSPINSLTDEAPGDEACPHPEQRDSTHTLFHTLTPPLLHFQTQKVTQCLQSVSGFLQTEQTGMNRGD